MAELSYDVLVSDGVRRHRSMRLPDGSPIVSSPLGSTLILGDNDAVLADPPFTWEQVRRVGEWVAHSGRRLAYIYATHGHGDHWFGTDLLMQRFPGAVPYATRGTIRRMHEEAGGDRRQRWDGDFPGLIPESPVIYQSMPDEGFTLEGHRLLAVETGHTDTDDGLRARDHGRRRRPPHWNLGFQLCRRSLDRLGSHRSANQSRGRTGSHDQRL